MIFGLAQGLITLGWAMLVLAMVIYVAALICRDLLGRSNANTAQYFNSVPRSVFTIFRCSFGDCSTYDGMPLIEHILRNHKDQTVLWYTLYGSYTFFITIGLFNII